MVYNDANKMTEDDIMTIEIANRLVKYRKQSGLSQETLADKLGISRQAVSKWERAEAAPDIETMLKLSQIYGVSLDDMMKKDPEEIGQADSEEEQVVEQTSQQTDNTDTEDGRERVTVNFNGAQFHFFSDDDEEEDDDDDDDEDDDDDDGDDDGVEKAVVNIGLNGVYVKKGKKVVNINTSGVNVDDGDKVIEVGPNGVRINKANESRAMRALKNFPMWILVVAAYLGLGFGLRLWHPGWIIFFLIPIWSEIVEMIATRDVRKFPIVMLVVAGYLVAGCVFGEWLLALPAVLLIPLYYWVAHIIHDNRT